MGICLGLDTEHRFVSVTYQQHAMEIFSVTRVGIVVFFSWNASEALDAETSGEKFLKFIIRPSPR
jgi:hypothetical protein